ncbi:MAG TPA: FHA domain-containing protein [Solirubrobacterales bacterium]|nr:FHA domain-containing protein [Solirubrobacterales bacterium]
MTEDAAGPHPVTAVELKAQIEAERTGRPFLAYRDEEGQRELVMIDPDVTELWVGRSPSADVQLAWDDEVSGLHAQLEVVRDECTLVDEGLSRNGSFVNGERVAGRRHLRDGDMLRFGHTMALFRAPATAEAKSTVVASDALAAADVSPAQRRVLVALCRPFKDSAAFATPPTNQQLAEELHLSVDAVKTHMRALFEKFGVQELPQNRKRVAVVERALQTGLVAQREL